MQNQKYTKLDRFEQTLTSLLLDVYTIIRNSDQSLRTLQKALKLNIRAIQTIRTGTDCPIKAEMVIKVLRGFYGDSGKWKIFFSAVSFLGKNLISS